MGITIVSVNHIAKAGYSVTFKENTCHIRNKAGKLIGTITARKNGLYKVKQVYAVAIPDERMDLAMLHHRLAHIAPDAIRKFVRHGAIEGIQFVDDRIVETQLRKGRSVGDYARRPVSKNCLL